ncbi:MAG TPA: hypothetical protein VFZ25_12390 [Chloroflexota bacterium]|nr:hypothetical protein [Chloroflexota bacterium]
MKTKVIVSGAIANKWGNGGATWTRLSWIRGLQRLGFEVYVIEQIARANCVDGAGRTAPFAESVNLAYFRHVIEEFGLADRATLVDVDSGQTAGHRFDDLEAITADAACLINITGHLTLPGPRRAIRRAVYLDLDPGFTQFWHAAGNLGPRLAGHDFYFTVGENVGQPGCAIPTGGIRWRPTRQPVVLSDWPVTGEPAGCRFTTIASWRGPYGPIESGGTTFGLKVHEFRKFLDLPRLASAASFEIALDIHPADEPDRQALLDHGWRLVDPRRVAGDPGAFRRYVQGSNAEVSAAQGMYVATNSGWFSDRTVRYLASGRPAVVQDTGFGHNYPVGDGLLAFRTAEEASTAARRVAADLAHHGRAARALAEAYFDSNLVLGQLIEEIGIAP